jgi:hypothetical protein
VGPPGKIKDELQEWKKTVLTTMIVAGPAAMLRPIAELVLD